MKCYLCKCEKQEKIKGEVRDRKDIDVLKCTNCGLVFLHNKDHITEDFYDNDGMNKTVDFGNITAATAFNDTEKRFKSYQMLLANKDVLDFGCGDGHFLRKLKNEKTCNSLNSLEPNKNCGKKLKEISTLYTSINEIPDESIDVITMFHVMEHLPDPLQILNNLESKLRKGGKIIIEVPSSDDALLNLYGNEAFSKFTYWSCHLYLFNPKTLKELFNKTSYKIKYIKQYQRYSLANHLHWLAKGKPAGHIEWSFLDDNIIQSQYEKKLAEIGQCDTIIGLIEK